MPDIEAELASSDLLHHDPGGIGHAWYRTKFILPFAEGREKESRFVPAKVGDNRFNNPEYTKVLANLTGWQKRAWFDGDWEIAAGQFFTTFRRDVHVIEDFDDIRTAMARRVASVSDAWATASARAPGTLGLEFLVI